MVNAQVRPSFSRLHDVPPKEPHPFDLGFHPSGRRLLLVVLSGTVEVTVPSGDSRRFEPGTAFVSEDIASGHATRTVDGPAEMLFVPLPEGNGWHIGP